MYPALQVSVTTPRLELRVDAHEATSEAFLDNRGSNGVSRALGYHENGTVWATCQSEPAQMQRWLLTRDAWQRGRRNDIALTGVQVCRDLLGIETPQRPAPR